MSTSPADEFEVIGFSPLGRRPPFFGIPIFASADDLNLLLIQEVDEISGLVRAFVRIDAAREDIVLTHLEAIHRVGRAVLLCFVDESGRVVFGDRNSIAESLKTAATLPSSCQAFRLQAAEVAGSVADKLAARSAMTMVIEREAGNKASWSFLEKSVLRTSLWDRLLENAPTREAGDRILKARRHVDVDVDRTGKVVVSLSTLSPDDLAGLNAVELARALETELKEARLPLQEVLAKSQTPDAQQKDRVSEKYREILVTGRQEERVAKVLYEIRENPKIGKEILHKYTKDKAGFATHALSIIERSLDNILSENQAMRKASWHQLISSLMGIVYPTNRGVLLYFFAHHLGGDGELAEVIEVETARSRSTMIDLYRSDIAHELAAHRR